MWGSALLGQELDIYQNLVVSKWTWTEEVLAIFLTPPPYLKILYTSTNLTIVRDL